MLFQEMPFKGKLNSEYKYVVGLVPLDPYHYKAVLAKVLQNAK